MQVVKIEDFDLSKVTVSDINVNKYGGKSVYINYDNNKKPLYLSLPSMVAPFGLNRWQDEGNKDAVPRYSVILSFNGMENNPKLKTCYEKLKAFDDLMVNIGVKNSKKWFKKTKSKAVIEDNYNSIILQDEEKKYPPKFRKINIRSTQQVMGDDKQKVDKLQCTFYDSKKKDEHRKPLMIDVSPDQIVKRTVFKRTLIRCKSLYLLGSKFGLTWQLEQVKVEFPMQLNQYALGPDSDDEDEDVADTNNTITTDTHIEDTDDDTSDESESEDSD